MLTPFCYKNTREPRFAYGADVHGVVILAASRVNNVLALNDSNKFEIYLFFPLFLSAWFVALVSLRRGCSQVHLQSFDRYGEFIISWWNR